MLIVGDAVTNSHLRMTFMLLNAEVEEMVKSGLGVVEKHKPPLR